MTRFEKRILIMLGMLMLGLALLEASVPAPVDWGRSFSREHTKPFGAKLLYQRLVDLFPEVQAVSGHDLGERAYSGGKAAPNHIFVNSSFAPDVRNTAELLRMVADGQCVLIAADDLLGPLADSLAVAMDQRYIMDGSDTMDVRFVGGTKPVQGVFRLGRSTVQSRFTRFPETGCRVLAVDGTASPVLLELDHGEGRFVLCSTPLAFTNYHLLKPRNAAYLAAVLGLLPPNPLLWDEYYKAGRAAASTPLRWILSQPPLRWAWFLALLLLALHLLVHQRREQRPIPVIDPPRNSSRELVHTVGRLLWHQGDHAALARRMIAHFKEEVRSATYLRTFAYDTATATHLAAKTGLDTDDTQRRLRTIEELERAPRLSETQLLQLAHELHAFRELIR